MVSANVLRAAAEDKAKRLRAPGLVDEVHDREQTPIDAANEALRSGSAGVRTRVFYIFRDIYFKV